MSSQSDENLLSLNKKDEKNPPFSGVMLGPYIKSRGNRGTKMSANLNAGFITVETYAQQGKTIENQFFIYGPNVILFFIFGYLKGPNVELS